MTDTHAATDADTPDPTTYRPVAPVDPTNLRPLLFLDVAREMMFDDSWPYRAVSIVMESHGGPGRFAFYGANRIETIQAVHARRVDLSILNPSAILTMAHRGVGAFDAPQSVATIATLRHHDQLGFAVRDDLGYDSLEEIARARPPLRVSVRGSLDDCTGVSVDLVLKAHGFSLGEIVAWGGEVSRDQPMPNDPSRLGRLQAGELDAIFDEGVSMWVDRLSAAGAHLLPIGDERLARLRTQGFRPGLIERARYRSLPADVPTVDYSGWPIYCRTDTPAELVERFCRALVARRDTIVSDVGPRQQPPLPLDQMVTDSPDTPMDVPLHPSAEAVWREQGFLS